MKGQIEYERLIDEWFNDKKDYDGDCPVITDREVEELKIKLFGKLKGSKVQV